RSEESLSDGTRRVILHIIPVPGVRAFAVEEIPAAGSTLVSVTSEGVYNSDSHVLRWGPFYGDATTALDYVVRGDAGAGPGRGVASFDGQSVAIRAAARKPGGIGPRLIGVDALHDGSRLVILESGEASHGSYELQVSSDLTHWSPVGNFTVGGLAGFIRDAGAGNSNARFYRAVKR
ncbi:MAG: hypothetical protein KIT22_11255, partial [Verrucomicrobiae bacterium]|nr:hypothetical protein [Verrucomicrobiae bacterium]